MKKDLLYAIVRIDSGARVTKLMARKGTLINEAKKSGYYNRETGYLEPYYKLVTYELLPIEEEL